MISQKEESTTGTNESLILGSSSVARKELLSSVGIFPDKIEVPDVDESLRANENPRSYVMRIAKEKAISISTDESSFLITADTIVTLGQRVLLKTSDKTQALEYLKTLSGRRHNVFTAFCVKHNGSLSSNLVKTSLKMRLLTDKEMKEYIASNQWLGCAGGYSIQGRAKAFFPFISGCFSNVIGLPIPKLIGVLNGLGFFQYHNEKRNNYR